MSHQQQSEYILVAKFATGAHVSVPLVARNLDTACSLARYTLTTLETVLGAISIYSVELKSK